MESEPSPESFNARALRLCRRTWHSKNWQNVHWFIVFHISIWGVAALFGVLNPPKPSSRCDGLNGLQSSTRCIHNSTCKYYRTSCVCLGAHWARVFPLAVPPQWRCAQLTFRSASNDVTQTYQKRGLPCITLWKNWVTLCKKINSFSWQEQIKVKVFAYSKATCLMWKRALQNVQFMHQIQKRIRSISSLFLSELWCRQWRRLLQTTHGGEAGCRRTLCEAHGCRRSAKRKLNAFSQLKIRHCKYKQIKIYLNFSQN